MGKSASATAHLSKILAAVSVLGISVGMAHAAASADAVNEKTPSVQDKHTTQIKLESQQDKWHSSQIKGNSSQIKLQSQQIKLDSAQQKGNSAQIKLQSGELNPQPLPPGAH